MQHELYYVSKLHHKRNRTKIGAEIYYMLIVVLKKIRTNRIVQFSKQAYFTH